MAPLQVCALWHAEMWLRGGGGCVVVEGLSHMTNRFTVPCVVCGRMVRSYAGLNRHLSLGKVSTYKASCMDLVSRRHNGWFARASCIRCVMACIR